MTFPGLLHSLDMKWFTEFFAGNNHEGPRDPSLGAMFKGRDPWSLDAPLFQWSPCDAFTLRNAVESVCIFGELGAAKTTGSAAWILLKYLQLGMGGLVCCVKPGDRELIEAYAGNRRAGGIRWSSSHRRINGAAISSATR